MKSFVFLLILTVLSYVVSYSGMHILPYIYIIAWLFIWKIFSFKQAMIFYLTILLIDGDISKFGALENQSFVTIYTEYIGGKSLFVFWTVINFLLLLYVYIKKYSFKINKFIIPFIFIFLLGFFIGLPNISLNFTSFISDSSYYINFFVGFLISWLYIKTKKDLYNFFNIFITVLLIKTVIIGIDSYFMSQRDFFNVYAVESTAYLYPILIVYSVLSIEKNKVFALISIILVSVMTMLTASRGRIAIILLSLLYSNIAVKKIHYYIVVIPLMIGVFIIISIWNNDVANYLMWKLNTFAPTDYTGKVSMSSVVRLIELKNILSLHFDKVYSFFTGVGFAGYFTSEYFPYPFVLYDTSSYPDSWIANDTFFKPHSSFLFLLLKNGVIGLIILYSTIIYLTYKVLKKVSKIKVERKYRNIIISIASFLPFLFLTNFTSKLQIFSGIFFGILVVFYKKYKKDNYEYNII